MRKLIGLLLTTCLTSCSPTHSQPANTGKYKPVLNPHPKYFMTVSGRVDPALKGSVPVSFRLRYQTTNPKCRWNLNSVEGVDSDRYISVVHKVIPNSKGNYHFKFTLDKYLPGYCNWTASDFENAIADPTYSDIVMFDNDAKTSRSSASANFNCNNKGCSDISGNNYNDTAAVTPNKTYQFTLNVRKGTF